MKISRLISDEKIAEHQSEGTLTDLVGRKLGQTTSHCLQVIGRAMSSAHPQVLCKFREWHIKKSAEDIIKTLGLKHLTLERCGRERIFLVKYDIFKDVQPNNPQVKNRG